MAVVATLRPAAVEGDCRRAIFARHSSLRHGRLRLVFNAQHSAEGTRLPMLRQFRGVAGCIRWISKGDIVRKRLQRLGESERGLSMDSGQPTSFERGDVLFQRAQTLRI